MLCKELTQIKNKRGFLTFEAKKMEEMVGGVY